MKMSTKDPSGFTLIRFLVVISAVIIISVVIIVTLNLADLLRRARDSSRLSDLRNLKEAIGLYLVDTGGSLGTASIVYVSIPDPSATSAAGDQCQGLKGLPTLPPSYAYHCASPLTYRNTDGTGWIPVNLKAISGGQSPLSTLPVGSSNTTSSRMFYIYTVGGAGKFEITTPMESTKYKLGGAKDFVSTDGGTKESLVETGTNLALEPLDYGDPDLMGYWSFEEGTGTAQYDYSGNRNIGTWQGTQAGTNGYYSVGKIGSWSGWFNGTDNSITIPNASSTVIPSSGAFSITAWINLRVTPTVKYETILMQDVAGGSLGFRFGLDDYDQPTFWSTEDGGSLQVGYQNTNIHVSTNTWNFIAASYTGSGATLYYNGVAIDTQAGTIPSSAQTVTIGAGLGQGRWQGGIDDVRIYKRALSSAEVAAMYSSGK
jgi:type II secretory pathway pseudopilin PulG